MQEFLLWIETKDWGSMECSPVLTFIFPHFCDERLSREHVQQESTLY
jgi:hypothetical protein